MLTATSVTFRRRFTARRRFSNAPARTSAWTSLATARTSRKNSGAAVNFRRWVNPAVNDTPNPEGTTPASRALTHLDYNTTVDRFAEVFEESRYNYDLDPWDSVKGAADVLGDLIVRTRERIRWNAARSGSNILYNSPAIGGRGSVNGAMTLGRLEVMIRSIEASKGQTFTELQKAPRRSAPTVSSRPTCCSVTLT